MIPGQIPLPLTAAAVPFPHPQIISHSTPQKGKTRDDPRVKGVMKAVLALTGQVIAEPGHKGDPGFPTCETAEIKGQKGSLQGASHGMQYPVEKGGGDESPGTVKEGPGQEKERNEDPVDMIVSVCHQGARKEQDESGGKKPPAPEGRFRR